MKKLFSLFVLVSISLTGFSQLSFDKVRSDLKTSDYLSFFSSDNNGVTFLSKSLNDDITKKRRKRKSAGVRENQKDRRWDMVFMQAEDCLV